MYFMVTDAEEWSTQSSAVSLCAGSQVLQHEIIDQSVSINTPEKVEMSEGGEVNLVIHSSRDTGQTKQSIKNILNNTAL